MEELISRQAAIDCLRNNIAYLQAFGCDRAVTLIEEVPSAEPEVLACGEGELSAEPDDAALHESCTDCPLYDHDRHRCPRFNKVIPTTIQEILDTQTQRWIPVTERLPGEDDYRPCYGYEDGAVWWVNDIGQMGLGWYYHSTGKWAYYDESDGCDKYVGNVVAWMPLPEPYREDGNEQ